MIIPICLFALILLLPSMDIIVEQSAKDLEKYEILQPFLNDLGSFDHGTLDLDLNIMECSFSNPASKEKIRQIMLNNNWQLINERDDYLEMRKQRNKIFLSFDGAKNQLSFHWITSSSP